jgi:fructose-1,6-bisphosphatase I
VLDLVPDKIHAKCPIIMGGKRDVQVVYDQYAASGVNVPAL